MDRHKRTRSSSASSSSSSTSSLNSKLVKPSSPPPDQYTCTLPPSCHLNPQGFPTSSALSSHYKSYHLYTCLQPPPTYQFAKSKHHQEQDGNKCGRIFPSDRMLELHLKECHDPLTHALQLSGNTKTFECFDSTRSCTRSFSSPKTRRLHLITEHDYPKEYFFGVTVWGIGDVLKKGGNGMIRREWKPRPTGSIKGKGQEEEGEDMEEVEQGFKEPSPAVEEEEGEDRIGKKKVDREMDELVNQLEGSSIGFVPRSVARKGKTTRLGVATSMSIEQDSQS